MKNDQVNDKLLGIIEHIDRVLSYDIIYNKHNRVFMSRVRKRINQLRKDLS